MSAVIESVSSVKASQVSGLQLEAQILQDLTDAAFLSLI